MAGKRFILIPGRTNKQGVQVNVGKDGDDYQAIVNTLTMHAEDMKELGIAAGASVRVRTETGEATFKCKDGNIPRGLLFVPFFVGVICTIPLLFVLCPATVAPASAAGLPLALNQTTLTLKAWPTVAPRRARRWRRSSDRCGLAPCSSRPAPPRRTSAAPRCSSWPAWRSPPRCGINPG